MNTITLAHLPSASAHIALFCNVRNADHLHGQLIARNPAFEYAFVDASVIVSPAHLVSAIFRACANLASDSLRTPNVHAEIVASLAISNNIAEAYRRFGITPTTTSLLVVKIAPPEAADEIYTHLEANVEGDATPVSEDAIAPLADWQKVRKYYKLNGLGWLDALSEERRRQEAEMVILSSMALRGV